MHIQLKSRVWPMRGLVSIEVFPDEHFSIYIYIYGERGRERGGEQEREREREYMWDLARLS